MKSALIALSLMLVSAPAFAWTCYSVNNAGGSFYGTGWNQAQAYENAIAACQLNTPYGFRCWISGCGW